MRSYTEGFLAKLILFGSKEDRYIARYYLAQEIIASDDLRYMNKCSEFMERLICMNDCRHLSVGGIPEFNEVVGRDLHIGSCYDKVYKVGKFGSWLLQLQFNVKLLFVYISFFMFSVFLWFSLLAGVVYGLLCGMLIIALIFDRQLIWFCHKFKLSLSLKLVLVNGDLFLVSSDISQYDLDRYVLYFRAFLTVWCSLHELDLLCPWTVECARVVYLLGNRDVQSMSWK